MSQRTVYYYPPIPSFSKWYPSFRLLPVKRPILFSAISVFHILRPSYSPLFYNPNYIWRRVPIMNVLITQFSPVFCYFPLALNVLASDLSSNPKSMLFRQCETCTKQQERPSRVYVSVFKFLVNRREDKIFWTQRKHAFFEISLPLTS
jgi:hypothetical protein